MPIRALIFWCLAMLMAPPVMADEVAEERPLSTLWKPGGPTLFGTPIERQGMHFQVAFGWGGGPDSEGLFHAMEIGYTMENGWTLGYLHTFIQNEGFGEMHGGPDLFGGHMFEVKVPLYYPEIVVKLAAGPGGTHDQSDGLKAHFGMSWAYGVDLHLPVDEGSGFTLGLTAIHATIKAHHHWGVSVSGGYTFF